eukprot:TRINITY_DN67210_c4_g1_i1.p1 TRINITY_DN67210_c4_g1~~TRINITY_DN67210_c4_g1_i1.p1  ORF type:complete len:180 (+),score=31.08 TRINITY_DN67210_c4_g1_i1:84-623(+)
MPHGMTAHIVVPGDGIGREYDEAELAKIREVFNLFDADGSGNIDKEELALALKNLGFGDLNESEVEAILAESGVVTDDSGQIGFQDFEKIMKMKMSTKDSLEEIRRAFALFDLDGTGLITAKNLRDVAKTIGESPANDTLQDMIIWADEDQDGAVTWQEFKQIMEYMTQRDQDTASSRR